MLVLYLSLITEQDDKKRFEHLYLSYRERLLKIARSILVQKSGDEDCVEDAFLYMAKHFKRFSDMDDEHVYAYLVTVVKTRAYDENDRRTRTVFTFDEPVTETVSDDFFEHVLYDELVEAILDLPDGYREILILSQKHGLSAKELTELLHLSKTTIYRRMCIAKKMLRDKLSGG